MSYDPLANQRASKHNILTYAATRRVLSCVADIACGLEKNEAESFLSCVAGEIEALRNGDSSAEIWRQATSNLSGPYSYGLERIGLWPQD